MLMHVALRYDLKARALLCPTLANAVVNAVVNAVIRHSFILKPTMPLSSRCYCALLGSLGKKLKLKRDS